jgi:broad specificity phosphatase PhoE
MNASVTLLNTARTCRASAIGNGRQARSPMPMLQRLYLVRHGETAWSLSGQHTGRTDIPLTERGEQDARTLADRLHGVSFNRVFTSPLQRARRSTELAALNRPAEIDPDLAEWDYGDYEGLRTGEIRGRKPDWNIFRDGCSRGESATQVSLRADRVIARLRNLEGDIAIFSHGHFGRALAARWIGLGWSRRCIFFSGRRHSAFWVTAITLSKSRQSFYGMPCRMKLSLIVSRFALAIDPRSQAAQTMPTEIERRGRERPI